MAYARLQYAKKHFRWPGATAYRAILVMHHLLRLAVLRFARPASSSARRGRSACCWARWAPPWAHRSPVHPGGSTLSGTQSEFVAALRSPAGLCASSSGPTQTHETTSVMGLPFHRLDQPTLIAGFPGRRA